MELFIKCKHQKAYIIPQKNSRPKDRYDATIIQNFVDKQIDYKLDTEKQDNYDINHQIAINSVVQQMEETIKNPINKQR